MERLEAKKINGKTYYYYAKWGWVNGKCRRLWQKYLGKAGDIVKKATEKKEIESPESAEIFRWGLSEAINKECNIAGVITETDLICNKREQGLSVGEYLAIAAMNRAMQATSKRGMWEWFSKTSLIRYFPKATESLLDSQRFWDHMKKITSHNRLAIWKNIITKVIEREKINLSAVSYDGTNFYTFIDTFNSRCEITKRGKNKQGRSNLRQVSYALFCCSDGHIPLFYDVYDGNRNDAKQFQQIICKFEKFFKEISQGEVIKKATTFIFDKGNNSKANFELIDKLQLHYVGSVKLGEHIELAKISNKSDKFKSCPNLDGTKAFRVKKIVYNKKRILVIGYNENLFNAQWMTLQNDIEKASEELSELKKKLSDRNAGIITQGKAPTKDSIEQQAKNSLKRPFLKEIISFKVDTSKNNFLLLSYEINQKKLEEISDTYLGKTIILTDQEDRTDEKIIETYRSQYIVEDVFKEMKDRTTGSWWPLHHWTDNNIHLHGLYCTIALLLKGLIARRVKKAKAS